MQILVTSPAKVRCNECGEVQIIDQDFFDDDWSSYDHGDNAMGEEIDHCFIAEVDCANCGNSLRVETRCSEYPAGAFNYDTKCEASGCELMEEPSVEPDYRDDMDEMYFYEPNWLGEQVFNDTVADLAEYWNDPKVLKKVSSREFERVVCTILKSKGFETQLTPATRDGGKDIIAKTDVGGLPFVIYVECKQWDETRKVGIDVVERLSAVQLDAHINKSVVVTTSFFTKGARDYAEKYNMSLIDWNNLKDWLSDAKAVRNNREY